MRGGAFPPPPLPKPRKRAGDAAAANSSGRIEPHHIRAAVRHDDNLAQLVGASALEQGGLLRPVGDEERAASPDVAAASEAAKEAAKEADKEDVEEDVVMPEAPHALPSADAPDVRFGGGRGVDGRGGIGC